MSRRWNKYEWAPETRKAIRRLKQETGCKNETFLVSKAIRIYAESLGIKAAVPKRYTKPSDPAVGTPEHRRAYLRRKQQERRARLRAQASTRN